MIYYPIPNGNTTVPENMTTSDELLNTTAKKLHQNFLTFSLLFALIHAGMDTILTLSADKIGDRLSSISRITFYTVYAFSLLIFSKQMTRIFDARFNVILGTLCLVVCTIGLTVAYFASSAQWGVYILSSIIGGFGMSLAWPGQSLYFMVNSMEFADQQQLSRDRIVLAFSGIFGWYFLAYESLFKLLGISASILDSNVEGMSLEPTVVSIYTIIVLVSYCCIVFLTLEFDISASSASDRLTTDKVSASKLVDSYARQVQHIRFHTSDCFQVAKEIRNSTQLQLLIPFQVTIGLSIGLIHVYVNGTIVDRYDGIGYIGLLAGIMAFSAALFACPIAAFALQVTNGLLHMILAASGVIVVGSILFLSISTPQLLEWGTMVLYFLFLAFARAVWESVNKAQFGIMFQKEEQRETAYCALYFTQTVGILFAWSFFPLMNPAAIGAINLLCAIVSVVCCVYAERFRAEESNREMLSSIHNLIHSASSHDSDDSMM